MNYLDEMRKQGKAFKATVGGRRTINPSGSLCKTPGLKLRSKGKGRGPLGIPFGGK